MSRRAFFALIVVLLVVIFLLPVLSMLYRSLRIDGRFTLASYQGLMRSSRQWSLMGHSLLLASIVTLATTSVGVPLGIILGRSDLPLRRSFTALFVIPLLIPPYIIAVSWLDLVGTAGPIAHIFGEASSRSAMALLFGLPGCAWVLFSVFLPVPLLLTLVFLRTVHPRLEEAGRLAAGWGRVLKGVTLPLIAPGILLAAVVVFLLSFGEFSVPNFLRYGVFPVETFTRFSAFYDFEAATAAAVPLAAVTFLVLLVEAVFLRERTYQLHPSPEAERHSTIRLGRWRAVATAAVGALALVVVVVPLVVLLVQAGGADAYLEALQRAGGSLIRSLLYGAAGASLLAVLGFLTGHLIETRAVRGWRMVDSLTVFTFALPSTVIGIGLISLWNNPWTNFVYATPWIILLGYVAKYTALTSRISVTQLAQIPPSMEEAAQVAGAGWGRRMVFITVPLARRSLLAAWLVGYIFSVRDTGITMLVYPAGHETLPVRIFTLMANGTPRLIAALCVLMIAATLLPLAAASMLPSVRASKVLR